MNYFVFHNLKCIIQLQAVPLWQLTLYSVLRLLQQFSFSLEIMVKMFCNFYLFIYLRKKERKKERIEYSYSGRMN